MEFTITCPIDGPVTVSLEDIDTVVLREAERADITFVCPHCGTEITVSAVVPSFLMAAIEALAEDGDSTHARASRPAGGDARLRRGVRFTVEGLPTPGQAHLSALCSLRRQSRLAAGVRL